jgi:hypothetical protein
VKRRRMIVASFVRRAWRDTQRFTRHARFPSTRKEPSSRDIPTACSRYGQRTFPSRTGRPSEPGRWDQG